MAAIRNAPSENSTLTLQKTIPAIQKVPAIWIMGMQNRSSSTDPVKAVV